MTNKGKSVAPFYVHHNGSASFVKTGKFFQQQGGLRESWGKAWRPVWNAKDIDEARTICDQLHQQGEI